MGRRVRCGGRGHRKTRCPSIRPGPGRGTAETALPPRRAQPVLPGVLRPAPHLATTSGQVTNAVYGFTSMLIKLLGGGAARLDRGRRSTRGGRRSGWSSTPDYKAGRRETPGRAPAAARADPRGPGDPAIPIVEVEGHEADDAIATLALRAAGTGHRGRHRHRRPGLLPARPPGGPVLFNRRGISDIVRYDVAGVTERFGLPPRSTSTTSR